MDFPQGNPRKIPMFRDFLWFIHHEMSPMDANLGEVIINCYQWMDFSSGNVGSNLTNQ
jgi:hypothetical protein